ncbi:MAG: protein kinase domain-containing protein [Bacteroidales bacterium]
MAIDPELEERLARFIERYLATGVAPDASAICEGRTDLVVQLESLAATYLRLSNDLGDAAGIATVPQAQTSDAAALPVIDGFRTIERLGRGGMGEVYKLQDLKLDRIVAGKIVRQDRLAARAFRDFLAEARTLALFRDPRIVQIHELRDDCDPPVIVMEFVDGFELGQVAPSLEYHQRARIVEQVAEAIHHAHGLGIQHRDLKPSNIMLDAALAPKILDFGLSGRAGTRPVRGTLPYLAPEQLDPASPIDARSDVYALGVVLYEVLCGALPYQAPDDVGLMEAIRSGCPRLPVEIQRSVPEPLQAIALKAMEREPAARYQSAHELAEDLRRYLEGRPVLARPRAYMAALESRVAPHLDHIADWLRLRLIYPHEAAELRSAYRALEARDDDWILSSRVLSYSQIVLYLGAFFLLAGSAFFLNGYVQETIRGIAKPFLVLGVPFIGLNVVARRLYRSERRAVAVAFYLAGVVLLPLFLVILLRENHVLAVAVDAPRQLFPKAYLSNHQLQLTLAVTCLWALFLALRTRTVALSTVFTGLLFTLALAVLTDFGLREWVEQFVWDRIAWHLAPLILVYAALGWVLERRDRAWLARPLYLAAALTLVAVLELLAQDGKLFNYFGVSMAPFARDAKTDPQFANTMMAMTANGVAMYVVALLVERRGPEAMQRAAGLLFTLAPFAGLKPLGWLCWTGTYVHSFDWLYLMLSLGSCVLSHHRQRRSFYIAGLMNSAWALYVIAEHNEWMEREGWAVALIACGLVGLLAGYGLDLLRRRHRDGAL